MIQNNNTKDVAYLGAYSSEFISFDNVKRFAISSFSKPAYWKRYGKNDTLLFDCHGTRYGFRIKKYKK